MDTRAKILHPDELAALLPQLASNGNRIALAKGWFDILLAEHCRSLAAAKRQADCLVAAVLTGDAGRPPVLDAAARSQLVAALAVVDYVVICDQSRLDELVSSCPSAALLDAEKAITRDVVDDVLQRRRSVRGSA